MEEARKKTNAAASRGREAGSAEAQAKHEDSHTAARKQRIAHQRVCGLVGQPAQQTDRPTLWHTRRSLETNPAASHVSPSSSSCEC